MDLKKFDSRFVVLPIAKIIQENEVVRTFVFKYPWGGRPGQFLMIWIPGVDEKPMSVAYDNGEEFWVTVCKVGPATEALFALKEGDKVGIRGPLGTWYDFGPEDHLAVVGGGYGSAPMYFVANEALKMGAKVDFFIGARNKDLLIYTDRVEKLGASLHVATNDGSAGFQGFITELLDQKLSEGLAFTKVFSCGPEVMMKAVSEVADKHGVPSWMSMEKYMKCGIGVCGQCALDDTGDLVCVKGPVMSYGYVRKLPEFGKYHRDAQGKKHYFS